MTGEYHANQANTIRKLAIDIEGEPSLDEPSQLLRRLEILERLEAYLFPLSMARSELSPTEETILDRLTAVQIKLEAINSEVFAAARREIRQGGGREWLLGWLPGLCSPLAQRHEGYDYLDDVITRVLQFEEPDNTMVRPTEEMVFYQPTPARHIFDLLDRTALTQEDVLVDIGSGLGHVPILTAICTNACSVGVEVEPSYVACAKHAVESLNLKKIRFVEQDVRAANFEVGTVFYLYTPFTGTLLRTTLDSLREEAQTRAIRICTFGPCTSVIAAESWLEGVGETGPDRISIFRSRFPCCKKICG